MDIHTYGITSSRYQAALTYTEESLLIPVTSNIVLWNTKTGKRDKILNYNTNAISMIRMNNKYIFSIAYNGEVVVINKDNLEKVKAFQSVCKTVKHASLTDDYLLVVGDKGPNNGDSIVFKVSNLDEHLEKEHPEIVLSLKGRFRFGHIVQNYLYILKENVNNQKEREAWKELKKENPSLRKQDKPKKIRDYEAELYSLQYSENLKSIHLDHPGPVHNSYTNGKDLVCTLYSDRFLMIMNPLKLEIIGSTKFAGVGAILSGTLDDHTFYTSPKRDYLLKINCENLNKIEESFDFEKDKHESIEVIVGKNSGVGPKNTCMNWIKKDETLAVHFDGEMNIIDFKTNKVIKNRCFEVSSCGLALSNNKKYVCGGDLVGNICIYPTDKSLDLEPLYKICIGESVRAITFDSSDESVIIGTLSHKLYRWYLHEHETHLISIFDHGVMNLRFNNQKKDGSFLIVGTSGGLMAVFKEIKHSKLLQLKFAYHAHEPVFIPNNVDFGSLHRQAEIWSTCWGPNDNTKIATCSEDQTCMIWDISKKNPTLLHKLVGHTKAVTSVDWKVMDEKIGEVFISCADDQTARIYDPKNDFKLVEVLDTSFIKEWHTLTYLALENGGTRLAMGAQNGFVFIYDFISKKFIYSQRLHQGSVEGLDWKGDILVTCAADNSIAVINIPPL